MKKRYFSIFVGHKNLPLLHIVGCWTAQKQHSTILIYCHYQYMRNWHVSIGRENIHIYRQFYCLSGVHPHDTNERQQTISFVSPCQLYFFFPFLSCHMPSLLCGFSKFKMSTISFRNQLFFCNRIHSAAKKSHRKPKENHLEWQNKASVNLSECNICQKKCWKLFCQSQMTFSQTFCPMIINF